jgi:hypothetical protein
MTTESRNSSLLDNGSLDTCPQQGIGLSKLEGCYENNSCFYGDVDSWRPTWYGTLSRGKGQVTNVLHGYRRTYKRPCREEWIHSSFAREFNTLVELSVQLWSDNQRTTEAEEVTDS